MSRQENWPDSLRNFFPIMKWFSAYEKRWLSSDLLAGSTLAAFTIPEAIAYSGLAGMPPQSGLYACIAGPILYMLFGTSRQLAVGPTSAVSILVAAVLGGLTVQSPAQYAALAAMTAILVGTIAVVAYFLRLGVLMNFISESVLVGFSSGAALYIVSTQLGSLFGIHGGHGEFFERVSHLIMHIHEANPWALALGLTGFVLILTGEHLVPKLPWALIVVLGSIGLMNVIDPKAHGISMAGAIPSGLPILSLPSVSLPDLKHMLHGALAIFMLAYVEGMSMARTFASKNGYRVDPNQELIALGFANIGVGLTQSFPLGGSFSRSALNEKAGARTQLAGGVSALLIFLVVLFLTGVFSKLPEPILAVVVIAAVKGLFKWRQFLELLELSPGEFGTAVGAFIGVMVLGILDGVVIGALLSILLVIRRASQSNVSLLGKVPGQPRFSPLDENPANLPIPGMVIVSPNSGIFYANAESVKDNIMKIVQESEKTVQTVLLDMATTTDLDLAGAKTIADLHQDLSKKNIRLRLSRVQLPVRQMLDRMGITAQIGEGNFHAVPLLAVAEYLSGEGLNHRILCDVLPDMMRFLMKIVRERAGLLDGEEPKRLEEVASKLEKIMRELTNEFSCETPHVIDRQK
ncbi:MAG: SulP family inorganic anion transporter [Desulfomonile tiedjei]|uniref:SulP family inorganic anion transporter n=1 Tax=Desulfomonile tiedjei TaxID=2358 RepID=A0A9D6UX28_9BACT|nr:SulP family inorganic anion transporter [Desulfomonile tiedjei]